MRVRGSGSAVGERASMVWSPRSLVVANSARRLNRVGRGRALRGSGGRGRGPRVGGGVEWREGDDHIEPTPAVGVWQGAVGVRIRLWGWGFRELEGVSGTPPPFTHLLIYVVKAWFQC